MIDVGREDSGVQIGTTESTLTLTLQLLPGP
jgi:hypothetical protein